MSVADDFDVLSVLQKAVIASVTSYAAGLPVKAIGRVFVPQIDAPEGKYLEIVWIPNNPTNGFWGDERNYMGMLRLVLHWPNDNAGAYPPGAVLAAVCAPFVKENLLGVAPRQLQIYEGPTSMGVTETSTETLYAAGMRYCSFRPGA